MTAKDCPYIWWHKDIAPWKPPHSYPKLILIFICVGACTCFQSNWGNYPTQMPACLPWAVFCRKIRENIQDIICLDWATGRVYYDFTLSWCEGIISSPWGEWNAPQTQFDAISKQWWMTLHKMCLHKTSLNQPVCNYSNFVWFWWQFIHLNAKLPACTGSQHPYDMC